MTSWGPGAATVAVALLAAGCGALDRFEDGGATVFVFATHHATPENGVFPDRGGEDMPRVFDNDTGWTVTLLEAYVTIASVTLVPCTGSERDLNMFWGPCPEDFKDRDLATLTVAGNRVSDGDYCGLRVTYAPFESPVIDPSADETRHETPTNSNVFGSTIYVRGGAQQGDEEFVQFELTSDETVVVDLDLSEIENGFPLNVAHREDFPKELLVSKAYDRFFDGIDFNSASDEAIAGQFGAILREQTKVSLGTLVEMPDEDEDLESDSG